MREYSWLDKARQLGLNTAVGAGQTLSNAGVAAMTGFGHYANMRNAPSIGNAFHRQAARSAEAWETSGLSARANTMAGRVGQNMVAATPFMRAGNVAGIATRGMVQASRGAQTLRRLPQALNEIRHLRRVEAGRKGAEAYRRSLPKTAVTVDGPSKAIYPSRVKYNDMDEYLKMKNRRK